MTHSDNITLLRQWFKDGDPEETNEKIIDLAVNWLKDDDAPQKPGERIWGYFNPTQPTQDTSGAARPRLAPLFIGESKHGMKKISYLCLRQHNRRTANMNTTKQTKEG